jgi:aspartate-semialdehyde dehydrogenase
MTNPISRQKVVIVGATGLVGVQLVKTLERLSLDVDELVLLASHKSAGKSVSFRGRDYEVQEFNPVHFKGARWVFFGGKDGLSEQYCPAAALEGAWVIDNSSMFRLKDGIPLVVPEINMHAITGTSGIIANPNCSTIQVALALAPIRDRVGIERVVISTYQSVSGAGGEYLKTLEHDTRKILDGFENEVDVNSPAFNLLPAIGPLEADGRFGEEYKLEHELRKILEMPDLPIVATAVRTPTRWTHGESVVIETRDPITPDDANNFWRVTHGISVLDDAKALSFPNPRIAVGTDNVWIGRVRRARIFKNDLAFWVVADNLLKGAALNAVQIAVELDERAKRFRDEL